MKPSCSMASQICLEIQVLQSTTVSRLVAELPCLGVYILFQRQTGVSYTCARKVCCNAVLLVLQRNLYRSSRKDALHLLINHIRFLNRFLDQSLAYCADCMPVQHANIAIQITATWKHERCTSTKQCVELYNGRIYISADIRLIVTWFSSGALHATA